MKCIDKTKESFLKFENIFGGLSYGVAKDYSQNIMKWEVWRRNYGIT